MKLQDSGERISYGSSSGIREPSTGKGTFYSMPACALLRLSKHYENGGIKYGDSRNYMKGIPTSRCLDSALRHLFKYMDGMDDEDHLSAAMFNILTIMYMELSDKYEMQDIPERNGKDIFKY